LFVLLLVLVLSIAVLVLVLEAIQYSNPAHRFASYRESPRSTIGIATVRTAIEYEYRYTEYRFAEHEYDQNNCLTRSQRARKSLFCTHVVLSNATIRTGLDLSSIKTNPITAQKVLRLGCLDSITSTSTVSLSTSTTKSDARHVTTVVTRHVALLFVIQEHRSASAGF
jgi:hypothetical protein